MPGRADLFPPSARPSAPSGSNPAPAPEVGATAPDDVPAASLDDLRSLAFATAPVPMVVVDGAGTILLANHAAVVLTGATARAVIGAAAETVLRGPGAHPAVAAPRAGEQAPAGSAEPTSTEPTSTEATSTEPTSTEATSTEATSTEPTSTEATGKERTEAASQGPVPGLGRVQRAGRLASGTEIVWTGALGDRRRIVWTMTSPDPTLPDRFLLTGVDVTEHRAAEASWRLEAQTDPLTGLANRSGLHETLAEHLNVQRGLGCGLLFCDLDGFKLVNDTHGHAVGDALLTHVATRLRASVRPGDLIARLGGDEFVVVLPAAGPVETRAACMRVEQLVSRPIRITGTTLRVGVSVGIRVAQIGEDPHTVLQDADAAMYAAKAHRTLSRPRAS